MDGLYGSVQTKPICTMRRPRAKHGSTTVTQTGDSGPGRLAQRGKYFVNSGAPESSGSVVEPNTYYGDTLDRADNVKQIVTQGPGVGEILKCR